MSESYDLEKIIRHQLENRTVNDDIDLHAATEEVLNSVGASLKEFGGRLDFYGKDPIIPSVLRYGAFSAIGLGAKAAQIAAIWKMKTGETQDIHIDVRKALRRFATFWEGTLETVNGHPGNTNSELNSAVKSGFYQCKDQRWILLTCNYPQLRNNALKLLNCPPDKDSVTKAIAQWNAEELESAAAEAGVVMHVLRSPQEFLSLDLFQSVFKSLPLIQIEKIAESAPVPFQKNGDVLSGIRALGLGHVIAGAGIGRALALHGADVLNIWLKTDYEHSLFHFTSNIGLRSARLDINENESDRQCFDDLMSKADVFFSNRRPGFLQKEELTSEELGNKYPGLITATVYFNGEEGTWSNRVGFDISTGAYAGPFWLESLGGTDTPTNEPHMTPQIGIISDYVAAWLTTVGVLEALKRRATEGGSYKVSVSLGRTVCWLLSLGIFDQKYARDMANSNDEHAYVEPTPILAQTPMGFYKGVAEQVEMTRTPGYYQHLLEPLGSSEAKWQSA